VISRFGNEVAQGSCETYPNLEIKWHKVVVGYLQIWK